MIKAIGKFIKVLLIVVLLLTVAFVVVFWDNNSDSDTASSEPSQSTVSTSSPSPNPSPVGETPEESTEPEPTEEESPWAKDIDRIETFAVEDGVAYYYAYMIGDFDWNSMSHDEQYEFSKYVISECGKLLAEEPEAESLGVMGWLNGGNLAFSHGIDDSNTINYYKDYIFNYELDYETGEVPDYYTQENIDEFIASLDEKLAPYSDYISSYNFDLDNKTLQLYVDKSVKYENESTKQQFADTLAEIVSMQADYYFNEYVFLDFRYSDGTGFATSSIWDKNLVNLD